MNYNKKISIVKEFAKKNNLHLVKQNMKINGAQAYKLEDDFGNAKFSNYTLNSLFNEVYF